MGRHADFWAVTGDALDYTLDRLDITVDRAGRDRLLDAWLEPTPYPEVPAALEQISERGRRRLGVLSNGTPSMLSTALAAGSGSWSTSSCSQTFEPLGVPALLD